jgi:hypothetical protein
MTASKEGVRMPKYQIDFSDFSPTTIEVRHADSLDVDGFEVPADAMQFSFYDEKLRWQAPSYFVTNDVEIGPTEEMKAKHGISDVAFDSIAAVFDAKESALVTWDHPAGPEWGGKILVPMVVGQVALFDRNLRKVVWPPAG